MYGSLIYVIVTSSELVLRKIEFLVYQCNCYSLFRTNISGWCYSGAIKHSSSVPADKVQFTP